MEQGFGHMSVEKSAVEKSLPSAKDLFLGEQRDSISVQTHAKMDTLAADSLIAAESRVGETTGKRLVTYDKYKKTFVVDGEKASLGALVAARHLGIDIALPASLESSGEGKRARKLMIGRIADDHLYGALNAELATAFAEKTRRQDMLKAKAYEEIAKRSGQESKQLGVFAENIIIGVAEGIAIDRPDLGLTVMPANAYQDVEEKIDFIVATTHKRRGVGVDAGELSDESRSVGVQFTINTSKATHKADQIAKAKERGVHVDDIVYVAIDKRTLEEAIGKWEKANKPIAGPWAYLSADVRMTTLKGIFNGVLTDEQEKSLLKGI